MVGAGLAGLTAGLDLTAAGWDVVVLEARPAVGGRVRTVRTPFSAGLHAEAGGESIDRSHHALLALVGRFGLTTEDRQVDKIHHGVTYWRGRRHPTAEFLAAPGVAVGCERFEAALDELATAVDPDHPERVAAAEPLDRRSLADLLDDLHLDPMARFLLDTRQRGFFNAEPRHVSLLFAAQQAAAPADHAAAAISAMRIAGGNDRLPHAMAEELGDRVVLDAPVTRIEHDADGVRVDAGGRTHDGAWLVLACPLTPLRTVTFSPALPATVADTVHGLDLGSAAKVTIEYRTRFWETGEGSGYTVADLPIGLAWSPTDSYGSERGLLSAYVTGDAAGAAARLADDERIADAARQLDQIYPEGAAQRTLHAATTAWANEPFTGGGYAVFRPGQMLPCWPVLRAGTGRIRFAGEHTETLAGYMESAVRSGHRVAKALGPAPG
ncbi:MAG: hypothetical protein JWN46_1613 [Acidimicrobiales bacterium]|nr:hypothetical protein [Acidimicrobiales bacterium]